MNCKSCGGYQPQLNEKLPQALNVCRCIDYSQPYQGNDQPQSMSNTDWAILKRLERIDATIVHIEKLIADLNDHD